MRIAQLMLTERHYRLDPAAEAAFREYISRRMRQPRFANARSMRNAIDRLRLRQAQRLVAGGGLVTGQDLMEITAADVRGSRVFSDSAVRPDANQPGPEPAVR